MQLDIKRLGSYFYIDLPNYLSPFHTKMTTSERGTAFKYVHEFFVCAESNVHNFYLIDLKGH